MKPLSEEFISLIEEVLLGTATPEQVARLHDTVLNDPDACEGFVWYTQLVSLEERRSLKTSQVASIDFVADTETAPNAATVAGTPRSLRSPPASNHTESSFWPAGLKFQALFAVGGMALAAALYGVIITLIGRWGEPVANPPAEFAQEAIQAPARPLPRVAVLRNLEGNWREGSSSPVVSAPISPGRLQLLSGTADLEFDDGATIVLQGPCDLELVSAKSCSVERGRIAAFVPSPASGFEVLTETARIVDLGTEFGVDVSETGETEVHVMRGAVDATLLKANDLATGKPLTTRVTTGNSIRVDQAGIRMESIVNRAAEYVQFSNRGGRQAKRDPYPNVVLADKPMAYWPLNEASDTKEVSDLSGNGHTGSIRGTVRFGANGPLAVPRMTAAEFDGKGWIEIARPDLFAIAADVTVEAWVKLSPESGLSRFFSVDPGITLSGWGCGWIGDEYNPYYMQRVAVMTTFGVKDYYFQHEPIPENQWHHWVMILDAQHDSHFYLDGRWLATVEGTKSGKLPPALKAYIGRSGGGDFWKGGVAHLAVYQRSLEPKTIARHYNAARVSFSSD